jgi:hypothetical protein
MTGDAIPIPVRRGCAFVQAAVVKHYGAEFLALLSGSTDTEIVSVDE